MVIEETVAQLTSLKKESRLVFDLSKYQNLIKFNQNIRKLKDHIFAFFLTVVKLGREIVSYRTLAYENSTFSFN